MMSIFRSALIATALLITTQGAFAEESSVFQNKLIGKNQEILHKHKEKNSSETTQAVSNTKAGA
ncbi:hypothetical protein ACI2KR_08130 [Pseudomonas luteola]